MRDKFLFGLNEFFARFREDIFHRDGQQKGFHLGFRGQSNPITWKRLNKQTSCWQPLLLKNSSLANKGLPKPPGRPGTDPVFFWDRKQQHSRDLCPASGKICSYCHKTSHFVYVCQQAFRAQRPSSTTPQNPTPPGPSRKAFSMGTALPSQKNDLLIFLALQLPHPRFTHLSRTEVISHQ